MQAWLEERADEMARLLEELVRVPTENPPGRELARCAGVLGDAMERLGFAPELIAGHAIVRGSAGSGGELVYYHGHFDVVPAQSPSQFEPQRRDGRIVGRGTADMKGGLVSMLYGAAAARELGLLGDRRIVFHFVCDEETGSAVGSGHLREAGLIDPGAAAMVIAEPTGGVIWHACRGAITLRVRVAGREAHVGHMREGVNAFEHMIRIAEPLATLSRELLEADSILLVGGQAEAGAGFNVVPGSAWFSLDRRFNPDEELDRELERLDDRDRSGRRRRSGRDRGPAAATVREHRPGPPGGPAVGPLRRGRRGRRPAVPSLPRCARDALVLGARHPRLRLRRRGPRRRPRAARVHRRGRHAPLRRRLRPVRRLVTTILLYGDTIRHEDLLLITDDGCETLTRYPYDL